MKLKRNSMRYAHTSGHTNVVYASSDNKIITCGADGDIRIWESVDDDDPNSKCLGEFVTAVLQYQDKLLATNDLNVVDCYTYPEIERDGTDVRFTAQGTCITSNEKYVAVGSEDTKIKVYPKGESKFEFDLEGHKGPILSLSLNKDNLLASVSGDGTLKIWNIDDKKEVKTITESLPKCNSFEILAYTDSKKISVLNVDNWKEETSFSVEKEDAKLTCCSISMDGQFVAAGSETGHVYVWNLDKKSMHKANVQDHEELHLITSIAWNPKDATEFAYCDASGQLGTVVMESGEEVNGLLDEEAGEDIMDFHEGDFQDDDMNGVGGDADEDDEDGETVSLEKLKKNFMKFDEDDSRQSRKSSVDRERSKSPERIQYKEYKMQQPFQPSSTPSDLENRYLLWNEVGLVKSYTSGEDSSINVEFHDVATHHNLHVNNYLHHTMASLSSSVLALS
uniref:WD repeat-containing protein 55 homolog n=1 Tax=Megaselia scalaris TaxID=36166 RepID=T1H2D8_MEGSC